VIFLLPRALPEASWSVVSFPSLLSSLLLALTLGYALASLTLPIFLPLCATPTAVFLPYHPPKAHLSTRASKRECVRVCKMCFSHARFPFPFLRASHPMPKSTLIALSHARPRFPRASRDAKITRFLVQLRKSEFATNLFAC